MMLFVPSHNKMSDTFPIVFHFFCSPTLFPELLIIYSVLYKSKIFSFRNAITYLCYFGGDTLMISARASHTGGRWTSTDPAALLLRSDLLVPPPTQHVECRLNIPVSRLVSHHDVHVQRHIYNLKPSG
jgi:hypothetical protein